MTIRVLLFAGARELAGADSLEIDLSEPCTVGKVRTQLAAAYPRLQALVARSAIAVDQEFAPDTLALPAAATVALIPPVSGG
jgi:molybdopterin converting factor subunit 1